MTTDKYIQEKFPILAQIDSPDDLRALPLDKLPEVCVDIRNFIIDALSENPGHFASSMGAVDITVALHYVFNTPYDRIVWDVGHQAYSHKIITGRRDIFKEKNRKMNGLSGFPSPKESEYDSFAAGHASNSISAAIGMSIAAQLQGRENRNIVAVIGDASISNGLAFEALNNASINNSNLIIVLNDNDMAIDASVGALGEYMTRLNTSTKYNKARNGIYQFMLRKGLINDKGRGSILRFNNSIKALLSSQQNIFEGLNIRYFGPFDGHDVKNLVQVFNRIKDMRGPRIVHLRTRKGKGYAPAEADPTTWHAPGKFNKETGEILSSSSENKPLKFQDVFGKTLVELAEKDDKIVGITAAMPTGCSLTYMQEAFPNRAFDVGISEEHAVTVSGGMAKDGLKPFCCIYSTFLQRSFDEIIHDVALINQPVTFCIDRAGLVGEDGATHHGAFDLAYLRCIPNMIIASPYDEHYLRHLLYTASLRSESPMAIRYPRGAGKLVDWQCEMQQLPMGKGRLLNHAHSDIAVLSLGPIGNIAAQAIDELRDEKGIDVTHYDMIFLKPIDEDILKDVATKYRHIITVEDGTTIGGLGSAVSDWLQENNYTNVAVHKVALPDEFITQGTLSQLHAYCGTDCESIKKLICSLAIKQ